MKRKELNWVPVYLYYEDHNKILVEAVQPFVKEVIENQEAEKYFFIRYWEKGPHIRLRFLCNSQQKEKLISRTRTYFTEYFKESPSKRYEPDWLNALSEEQKWYPDNSIQFIEYEPETDRYGGPVCLELSELHFQDVSNATLGVMNEADDWNYERAMGAAIQMHLSFIYSLGLSERETILLFQRVYNGWLPRAFTDVFGYQNKLSEEEYKKNVELTVKAFDESFKNQKKQLTEFHKIIWEALKEGVEFDSMWLNEWIKKSKYFYTKLSVLYENEKIIIPEYYTKIMSVGIDEKNQKLFYLYESYIHMINNRLGIMNRDEAFLGYVIINCLQTISK